MDDTVDDAGFDAPWYEAAYPDVSLSGLTAAEHYRLIGRHLGRPPRPEPPKGELADLVAAVAVAKADDAISANPAELAGLPIVDAPEGLAFRPCSRQSLRERSALSGLERNLTLLNATWPLLDAFARLHRCSFADVFGVSAPADRATAPMEIVGLFLRDGAFRIGDLWFASATSLCLRIDLQDVPEQAGLVLYQMDPSTGGLCQAGAQALCGPGPVFVEGTLRNPLMPVLVELVDPNGQTRDLALLAFPSLARGGLHGAELVGVIDGQTTTETFWNYTEGRLSELDAAPAGARLSRVLVSLDRAGGGEPIFSRVVAEWLALFGLEIEAFPGAEPSDWDRLGAMRGSGPGQEDGPALILPCEGLPTIVALTGPVTADTNGGRASVVPYLIADLIGNRPAWAVTLPSGQVEPEAVQAESSVLPLILGARAPALPLAILYRDPRPVDRVRALLATMPELAPVPSVAAPTGGILCLLDVSSLATARLALDALAAQRGAGRIRVALAGDGAALAELGPDLEGTIEGPVERLGPKPMASHLLEATLEGEAVLFLEDRVVLHDPRTLAFLRSLLARPRIASAACVVLHESMRNQSSVVATESGGYMPSRMGLAGGPHLVFEQLDTAQALPEATYPVVANALSATLVSRAALVAVAEHLPRNRPLDDLTFGLTAQALGWRHLCTSVLRAVSVQPRRKGERVDPVALHRVAPTRWEELLSEVTLLRELR